MSVPHEQKSDTQNFMFFILYNILLFLAAPFIYLFSVIDPKLRESGREQKNPLDIAEACRKSGKAVIWMHAASAGEFEQIRPLAERLFVTDKYALILSVSSKTIMDKVRNDPRFTVIFYNPWDFPVRTRNFVKTIRPTLYLNTRHDLWFNLLRSLKREAVPVIQVNTNMYAGSRRLRVPFRSFNRSLFGMIDILFTSTDYNRKLIELVYDGEIIVSGDTRFDQVVERKNRNTGNILPDQAKKSKVCIYGSLVDSDQSIVSPAVLESLQADSSLLHVLVPHEVDTETLERWEALFKHSIYSVQRISTLKEEKKADILIWDRVGQLADLYGEGDLAYVGAGFSTGVHNVIEPAVYGIPVAYGPRYEILSEAIELAEQNISFVINNKHDLLNFYKLLDQPDRYEQIARETLDYVRTRSGASDRILKRLKLI